MYYIENPGFYIYICFNLVFFYVCVIFHSLLIHKFISFSANVVLPLTTTNAILNKMALIEPTTWAPMSVNRPNEKLPNTRTVRHNEQSPKCPKHLCSCGRKFTHDAHLRYHQRWECGQVLICRICCRIYNTKSNLMRHVKTCGAGLTQLTNRTTEQ